ncbi:MAG: hypothetical protein II964_02075, partial [Synergistaceae bacterium]|nr:hypothetical protein [Synergistaceae bacterium]
GGNKMSEQKKARVVVLPCGKLCERVYCGDCVFFKYERDNEGYCKREGCTHHVDYYCDYGRSVHGN